MLAAYKLRAVPVNVNYRYVESELAHLYDDADLVRAGVSPDVRTSDRGGARACTAVPGPLFVVDDGSDDAPIDGSLGYEELLAAASPDARLRRTLGRRPVHRVHGRHDRHAQGCRVAPRGHLLRGDGRRRPDDDARARSRNPDEIVDRVLPTGAVMLLLPPLMHVSAQWGAFSILYGGGTVVLASPGSLDAHEVWSLVGEEHVNILTIVG